MSIRINTKLKPCPFCGGEAYENVCDILIQIGCKTCNYHMAFPGLLRNRKDYPECPIGSKDGRYSYYAKADEEAENKWNTRVSEVTMSAEGYVKKYFYLYHDRELNLIASSTLFDKIEDAQRERDHSETAIDGPILEGWERKESC